MYQKTAKLFNYWDISYHVSVFEDLEKWANFLQSMIINHQDPCTWNIPIPDDIYSVLMTMTDTIIPARMSISLGIKPPNTTKPEINSPVDSKSLVASQLHKNCLDLSVLFNILLPERCSELY